MNIRRIHGYAGMFFGIILLFPGIFGGLLLLGKVFQYSEEMEHLFFKLHNLVIINGFAGLLITAGAIFMTCSGYYLAYKSGYFKAKAK